MSKLAIYFPGIGYHCDKPLLYYSRSLARELGYQECRNISYTYEGKNIRGDQAKMREAYETLFQQAEKELEEIDCRFTMTFCLSQRASGRSLQLLM